MVDLVAIEAGDRVTGEYVERVLSAHHIESRMNGSIGWGVSVPARDRREAEKVLRAERELRGFITWLP